MNNPNKISAESFFSIRLEQRRNNIHQGWGTGFVYQGESNSQTYLVTNYHVLMARDPKEPSKFCSGYADSPDEICWYGWEKSSLISQIGSFKIDGNFQFLEHKKRSQGVDLVAIPIRFPEDMIFINQMSIRNDHTIPSQVGSEIFIVGFPYGYGFNEVMPIWKRGTIASEPLLNESQLPRFLIDANTNPGMSGAPVFSVARRDMLLVEKDLADKIKNPQASALNLISKLDPQQIMNTTFQGISLNLVGIYAGRVQLPEFKDLNLGIVYKLGALNEILKNPVIAQHPFPHC